MSEEGKVDTVVEAAEFKFKLNGIRDLQTQLEEFKKACDGHEKQKRRRCKRRYYHMGVMAKVVDQTNEEELRRLLSNGTRTFLFDAVMNKPNELAELLQRTKNIIAEFQIAQQPMIHTVISLALEITGDCCRLGRLHNNCSLLMARGTVITLTSDESYRFSGFKEIAFVINLKYYIKTIKLNDEVSIGPEVRGKVVKRLPESVAVFVEHPGIMNSYEYIVLPNQCYALSLDTLPELFREDLLLANQIGVNYIVMPNIRCKIFLQLLQMQMKAANPLMKLIGTIDYAYIIAKMIDLMGIVKLLDYVWIQNAFSMENQEVIKYIYEDVVPIAKCLKKPIIGTVPLERCSDFKRFENHDFLWKIDAIYIEKSPWCNKYPLIVRKLLPIRDFRLGVVDNCMVLKSVLDSYHTVVNFIIRTISTIECQAIFMHSKCETAALALGRVEIYCPVYIVFPLRENEEYAQENICYIELARSMNLRRNLRAIVFDKQQNDCNYKPIEYGIEYTRHMGQLSTGDFIISLEICKEDEENVEYGVGDDIVILRAFYLPPSEKCEKYNFS